MGYLLLGALATFGIEVVGILITAYWLAMRMRRAEIIERRLVERDGDWRAFVYNRPAMLKECERLAKVK